MEVRDKVRGAAARVLEPRTSRDELYRDHPWWVLILSLGLMIGGWALLREAVRASGPIRGLGGATLVTVGLLTWNRLVRHRLPSLTGTQQRGSTRRKAVAFAVGVAGLVLGALPIAHANVESSWQWAVVGVFFVGLSLGPFSLLLEDWRDGASVGGATDPGHALAARLWVLGGLLASLIAWILVVAPVGLWGAWAGVAVLLPGLVAFEIGLPGVCDVNRAEPGRFDAGGSMLGRVAASVTRCFPGDCTWHAGLVAAVGASTILVFLVLFRSVPVALLGCLILLLSAIALGLGFRRRQLRSTRSDTIWWSAVCAVGALLVAVNILQMASSGVTTEWRSFGVAIGLLVAAIGTSMVWRGEALFFGVLLGFAIVFGLQSSTVPDAALYSTAELTKSGEPPRPMARVVSFGDSWISGEGADEFFADTDQRGTNENGCRRAPTAYSVRLAELLDTDDSYERALDFYACSGADVDDLINLPTTESKQCDDIGRWFTGQQECSPAEYWGRMLQLDNVSDKQVASARPQLIIVSVGGNDAGFGNIVKACLLPGSCADRREAFLENIPTLGPTLEQVYTEIRERFAVDGDPTTTPPIVVMPYPLVLTEERCDSSPFGQDEHTFLVEFTTALDEQLAVSARRAGVYFFEDGMFAFEGYRLCERDDRDDLAVNLVDFQASQGDFVDRLNPSNWGHNSMHPNELGHDLTYSALAAWLLPGCTQPDDGCDIPLALGPSPSPEAPTLEASRTTRSVRPFPLELDEEFAHAVRAAGCETDGFDAFASEVFVFDDPNLGLQESGAPLGLEEDQVATPKQLASLWWPVAISGASDEETVCYRDQQGNWQSVSPEVIPRAGDEDADQDERGTTRVAEAADVYVLGGEVFLKGRVPASDVQWVVFQDVDTGGWEWRAIRYCSKGGFCESSYDEWQTAQQDAAIATFWSTLALTILGGFLFALGWSLAVARVFFDLLVSFARWLLGDVRVPDDPAR